ncbi:hypothetical protein [Pseudomonas vancouverensis]|uniref:Lipoprotein n=1 Tax=Pseudomonas vancouverensis TaxID=95300 RepID=A0A1H2NFI7_PSEVA|nr:hypothetical protein [Pseudomonas vancouverensis]KAB0494305.1 hypothetical protein F7R09_21300 [Pseudomonas vancouverensis]TDB60613.1 hypothetical protein EIY72_17405 [Pseudomonas vancouverensis]SDV04193.1 hypothetical protein SAMN05216558_2180 [Pseudomonas vancouverensis]
MKWILWTLALASMAGCAVPTMSEMRKEDPRQILTSKKPEKVVADCVLREWQDLPVFAGHDGATLEPGSHGGYTVATVGSGYFVDISKDEFGSVAKYYAATHRWISRKHLEALQRCL